MFFSSLLTIISLIFFCLWKRKCPKGFPPGPWSIPFLGNVLQFGLGNPLEGLDQLAKKYGPVFSLYLGGKPMVFTHGFSLAKEVLMTKGTEFAGRVGNPISDLVNKRKGIASANYGQTWKEQRRFSLKVLRNFGLGKKSMEEKILDEADFLIQAFTENMNMPFDPFNLLGDAVTNIISSLIFTKHFEYNDPSLRTIQDLIHEIITLFSGPWTMFFNAVPLVRGLPLPHRILLTKVKKVYAFVQKEVEEHKATWVPGECRDFIDAYLEEIEKQENKGSSFEEEQLLIVVTDLFIGGLESTTKTLQWSLLYMMAFPEIQEKCQKEIDTVLGRQVCLKYEDRQKLPYTNAVIHEIQRFTSVVPLGVPHAAIRDVELRGYKIPKGTPVQINIHSAHRDQSQWKFPLEFNPSNFLNEKGEFAKPEAFLSFSAGPRSCLGENLARTEIFIFFTSILRNFQLGWPDESSAPDLTPHFAVAQSPSRFKISLKSRPSQ